MTSVYNEMFDVTITANMITRHNRDALDLVELATSYGQVAVTLNRSFDAEDSYDISSTMDEQDRITFAGELHRLKNMAKKKVDTNGKGPDNDGPKPTNPRGSGGQVFEKQDIFAVAA